MNKFIVWVDKWIRKIKYHYNPLVPRLDVYDPQSRRNWIIYVVNTTKKYPLTEITKKMTPDVSRAAILNDLKILESQGLIRRTSEEQNRTYLYPNFEGYDTSDFNTTERKKALYLNVGLPLLVISLFVILIVLKILNIHLF